MTWLWLILYALGAIVGCYALATAAVLIAGALRDSRDSEGTMRWVSGETVFVPREPEREPRKRWRITIEGR